MTNYTFLTYKIVQILKTQYCIKIYLTINNNFCISSVKIIHKYLHSIIVDFYYIKHVIDSY